MSFENSIDFLRNLQRLRYLFVYCIADGIRPNDSKINHIRALVAISAIDVIALINAYFSVRACLSLSYSPSKYLLILGSGIVVFLNSWTTPYWENISKSAMEDLSKSNRLKMVFWVYALVQLPWVLLNRYLQ